MATENFRPSCVVYNKDGRPNMDTICYICGQPGSIFLIAHVDSTKSANKIIDMYRASGLTASIIPPFLKEGNWPEEILEREPRAIKVCACPIHLKQHEKLNRLVNRQKKISLDLIAESLEIGN